VALEKQRFFILSWDKFFFIFSPEATLLAETDSGFFKFTICSRRKSNFFSFYLGQGREHLHWFLRVIIDDMPKLRI
jgi:hypothetical protein